MNYSDDEICICLSRTIYFHSFHEVGHTTFEDPKPNKYPSMIPSFVNNLFLQPNELNHINISAKRLSAS